MLTTVLFDHDGLIVDTESSAYHSWQEIFQEYGTSLELSRWELCLGGSGAEFDPITELSVLTGRSLDREALTERRLRRKRELALALPVLPGVRERLREAKDLGLRTGLVSSSGRVTVEESLTRHALFKQFDAITTGNEVTRVKPHPDLYDLALRRLGARAEEAIVFEDSPNGVRAAQSAGIRCIAIPNTITAGLRFPEVAHIESLAHISILELARAQ